MFDISNLFEQLAGDRLMDFSRLESVRGEHTFCEKIQRMCSLRELLSKKKVEV